MTRVQTGWIGTTLVVAAALVALLAAIPSSAVAQQGNPEAIEHLNNAIRALSGDSADPRRALEEIDEVLELDPNNAQAYYYRGMANGQLQQLDAALDAFVRAGELAPGYTEAHVWATRLAGQSGNWELAWEQAILASQAGFDMSQAFAEMRQVSTPPDDFERRLRAPRVALGTIDVEAIAGEDAFFSAPSTIGVGTADASSRSDSEAPAAGSGAFGLGSSGESRLAEAQADIVEVRRTFGVLLQESPSFAMVQNAELANYVLTLKVNDVGGGQPRPMEGIVKLMRGAEEAYSRTFRFSDISSTADLRTEVYRVVVFMEEWQAERER